MILAPNHLQRLSGNNWILALCLFLVSCSATKPVSHNPKSQIAKVAVSDQKTKRDTIVLPEKKEKQNAEKQETEANKIDTIRWNDISDKNHPIKIDEATTGKSKSDNKIYNIKLMIPLNSDEISDPGTSRFTFFYAGALLALEELSLEGIHVNLEVIDTEENSYNIEKTIDKFAHDKPDMVIGPFERDDIKRLSDFCKEEKIPIVSPWYTSSRLTSENPYYVQINPNLKEHFLRIVKYTVNTYKPGEVVILIRSDKDKPWIDYFEEEAKKITGKNDFFSTYVVNSDSLRLGPTAFNTMFKKQNPKAVILPNYSYNDESYIYSSLRRLAAEIGTKMLSVIGMPILYESDKIEFDYYRSLQMKVVKADYVDEDYGKIREFRRRFLDTYGEIPTVESVKGHDLFMFLIKNLMDYGDRFSNYSNYDTGSYQANFQIEKAVSDDTHAKERQVDFDFYENKYLDIIEFRGNKWIRL